MTITKHRTLPDRPHVQRTPRAGIKQKVVNTHARTIDEKFVDLEKTADLLAELIMIALTKDGEASKGFEAESASESADDKDEEEILLAKLGK